MKKKVTNVLIFVGFLVYVLGLIIDVLKAKSTEDAAQVFLTSGLGFTAIAAALAVCFIFAKNEVVKNVGFSLCAICGVVGVITMFTGSVSVSAIGLIIMFVGAIVYAIYKIITFFGFVKGTPSNEYDQVYSQLVKCSELSKEGIITDEEMTSIKGSLLKNMNTTKADIADLRKIKKLLDEEVITQEEFAEIKSKMLIEK